MGIEKISLTADKIVNYIPHRSPFLYIDKLLEIRNGVYARGQKIVSDDEWFFSGHFPDRPIMPGVLITEALGQTFALLSSISQLLDQNIPIGRIEAGKITNTVSAFLIRSDMKFIAPVFPGVTLDLFVLSVVGNAKCAKANVRANIKNKVAATGKLTAVSMDL